MPGDINDMAKRQGRLLWSERALGALIESGGKNGDLLYILEVSMGERHAPTVQDMSCRSSSTLRVVPRECRWRLLG